VRAVTAATLAAPPLLQTLDLIADPIRFFDKHQQRHGDSFTARVLGLNSPPVHFFGEPNAIQTLFTAPPDTFAMGRVTDVFRPLTGPHSLIQLDGAEHQRQRKLLMPPLHGDLSRYGNTICQLARAAIADLPPTFAIRDITSDIALQVILRVVFGLEPGERYNLLRDRIARLLEAITHPLASTQFFFPPLQQDLGPWSPWGRFRRQLAAIDGPIYAEIAERRRSDTPRTDILSLLLSARDEAGQGMTDAELRDQLATLLLLGHETTASSLAWAFHWIHTHPDVRDRLRAELTPDPEALAHSPYLHAVCQETLRINPIALIAQPRLVRTAIALGERTYEPGAIVVPCIYLAHRRAASFPEAGCFRPERFLERKVSPYEFFPFGGGVRACIGGALSLFEMKLVLGTILSHLDLELVGAPATPVRRGITIVPSGGVTMRVVTRHRR